jgi:hypothetical protein
VVLRDSDASLSSASVGWSHGLASVTTKTPSSRGARIGFWVVAFLGVPAAAIAWAWYGFALFEAQTEQSKALAAGTSMAGFGETLGGVPLALAHLVGLATLVILGWNGYRGRGIALAIAVVLISSAIGIGGAQLVWAGNCFSSASTTTRKFLNAQLLSIVLQPDRRPSASTAVLDYIWRACGESFRALGASPKAVQMVII